MSERERTLLDLARRDRSDVEGTFRSITEAAAVLLGVARTGIWRFASDGVADATLACEDLYLRDERRHATAPAVTAREMPRYFDAISSRRFVAAHDALSDPRTAELADSYLRPSGISSMLDVPIWQHERLYGILCHEHVGPPRRWGPDDEALGTHLADLASAALEAAERVSAEHRVAAVFDAVAEAVVVLDPDGSIVRANPVAREQFLDRLGGGETIGKRMETALVVDADERPVPREMRPFPRAVRGEIVRGEVMGVTFTLSGERRYYRVTSAPIFDGHRLDSVVMIIDDVTAEMYLERTKREFLAALAHELKTPLAIVKGYSQQLEGEPDLPARFSPRLEAIDRAVDRMDRLTQSLLDASIITFGRLVLTRGRVDLAALVRETVKRVAAASPSHEFRCAAPDAAPVNVDAARIEQVIRRLLDNAVRYSPDDGRIDVELVEEPDAFVVSVRDRGIGIPAEALPHVFEMFFRAHAGTPHDRGGLGIGLFLAWEVVKLHDGELDVESRPGEGSVFRLRLPRAEAA